MVEEADVEEISSTEEEGSANADCSGGSQVGEIRSKKGAERQAHQSPAASGKGGAGSGRQKRERSVGAKRNCRRAIVRSKRVKGAGRRGGQNQEKPIFVPPLLFSADNIPEKGRVNSYSKPEYILDIVEVLHGSAEYEWLKQGCFAKLFDLPTRRCSLSGKLVHQFLCRTMVTKKRHELWFVFSGYPLRFSLWKYATLTGMNCGPYPTADGYTSIRCLWSL